MKTRTLILLPILAVLIAVPLIAPAFAGNGNGLPSGKHYTLNILGKNWNKGDALLVNDPYYNPIAKENDNGHRMFVKLSGTTRILLYQDTEYPYEFSVIDCDGTDGKASFMLPAPGDVIDSSGQYNASAAAYKIFVRVLGPPSGSANMTTGAFYYDELGLTWMYVTSLEYVSLDQTMRPPAKFTDVTKELTTLWLDTNADGIGDTRIVLFDSQYDGYFWDYANDGLKHVQLRFYPTELFPTA